MRKIKCDRHINNISEYINIEEGYVLSEVREIVTRAVVAKGKKIFRITDTISPVVDATSVLGCWIINHEFEANLNEKSKKVELSGTFEIDVWYADDNNCHTEIARHTSTYNGTIKVREIICDNVISEHCDTVARIIQQPTCTNAKITDQGIEVDVVFEVIVEVIGETKMVITVFEQCDTLDACDDFENEINEDFLNENPK